MSKPQLWSAPAPLTVVHQVADFNCGESILDHWLKHRASRTYALRTDQQVAAHYCLATGSVASELAPGCVRHNMPDPIPVMILGRLVVAVAWQRHGLGKALLRDAILRTIQVSEVVGVRALLVHALFERAAGFYDAQGFRLLPVSPRTVFLRLSEV